MDGPHLFLISVRTTHPKAPRVELGVRALFG
jgi:hypothetical protein